ncbi:helix-turn-helix domain-containing protein [Kribbella sp. NPDC050470]|uniref:helix-turn-helix domain-containing protein n=1 Tax=unclassified Kribbella TaxID=2644121 RepID=UPI0037A42CE7
MVAPVSQLAPDERTALLRTARSRTTPQGLAIRAGLVVDCADFGLAEAARRSSVSRATAAKWWQRYRDGGIDGLDDATRSGRPPAADDVILDVLGCALDTPPAGAKRWTTRAVAEATGTSQATVSRIRRRYFSRLDPAPVEVLPPSTLVYLDVHRAGCVLGFHPLSEPSPSRPPGVRLDAMETVLCATLLSGRIAGHGPARAGAGERAIAILRRAAERLPSVRPITLFVDVELTASAHLWLAGNPDFTAYSFTGEHWLGLLHRVADAVDPTQLDELREIQRLVRVARSEGARQFTWSRAPEASSLAGTAQTEPPAGDLTHVVRGICAAVSTGELRAGEVISVRRIAELSAVSSGRASNALAQLAEEALIDKRSGRYRLPVPTPRDVVETYTARGLLGTAIARRLASVDHPLPPGVDDHYAGLVRCDQLELVLEAGAIDLDLQDELAQAAAMPRVGWMFIRLTLQLRIFITIFGLSYRYPTGEILADDRRILDEIRHRDPDAAVAAWRSKIDNCAHFMLTHLSAIR